MRIAEENTEINYFLLFLFVSICIKRIRNCEN